MNVLGIIVLCIFVYGLGILTWWLVATYALAACGYGKITCKCEGFSGGPGCKKCSGNGKFDGDKCVCKAGYGGMNCECQDGFAKDENGKCWTCSGNGLLSKDATEKGWSCKCDTLHEGVLCENRKPAPAT